MGAGSTGQDGELETSRDEGVEDGGAEIAGALYMISVMVLLHLYWRASV